MVLEGGRRGGGGVHGTEEGGVVGLFEGGTMAQGCVHDIAEEYV